MDYVPFTSNSRWSNQIPKATLHSFTSGNIPMLIAVVRAASVGQQERALVNQITPASLTNSEFTYSGHRHGPVNLDYRTILIAS